MIQHPCYGFTTGELCVRHCPNSRSEQPDEMFLENGKNLKEPLYNHAGTPTIVSVFPGHPINEQQLDDWLDDPELKPHPINVMPTQAQLDAHADTQLQPMEVERFKAAGLIVPESMIERGTSYNPDHDEATIDADDIR